MHIPVDTKSRLLNYIRYTKNKKKLKRPKMEKYICENLPRLVNACGLVFDIIGVILLWRFGLPAIDSMSREGNQYLILKDKSEAKKAKAEMYDRFSKIALLLIILGFALQFLSDFI